MVSRAYPDNNMQDDDLEDEEDEYEESEDGFVVPNGYISEDEGLGSVQQSLNDLCADLEGIRSQLFFACRPTHVIESSVWKEERCRV